MVYNSGGLGWSYPAGCSGPPDNSEYERPIYHCGKCGGVLKSSPESRTIHEDIVKCTGKGSDDPDLFYIGPACGKWDRHEPHEFVEHVTEVGNFPCRKCGAVNEIVL